MIKMKNNDPKYLVATIFIPITSIPKTREQRVNSIGKLLYAKWLMALKSLRGELESGLYDNLPNTQEFKDMLDEAIKDPIEFLKRLPEKTYD